MAVHIVFVPFLNCFIIISFFFLIHPSSLFIHPALLPSCWKCTRQKVIIDSLSDRDSYHYSWIVHFSPLFVNGCARLSASSVRCPQLSLSGIEQVDCLRKPSTAPSACAPLHRLLIKRHLSIAIPSGHHSVCRIWLFLRFANTSVSGASFLAHSTHPTIWWQLRTWR